MADKYYLKNSKNTIRIATKPFAGGGEGNLYKITSPVAYKGYVAKIYHPHKLSKEREAKTDYLIKNPPAGHEGGAIVWVKDALYDARSNFSGFIMPFVKGQKLEVLSLGKLSRKLNKAWHRFDLKHPAALKYRLRICFNLSTAIYQMHATNHYVLVDMKPDNIIVQANGLLSIVDTDSVEVIEDGKAIFPAPVATPEYTPPEFYTNNYRKNATVGESWDRFGLAVILYKLMFGIHPFTGSASAPYEHLVSLHQKIEAGLFVHSRQHKKYIKVIPPPHQKFRSLDPNLQDLFYKCFEEGHSDPELRPTANDWCSALLLAIGDPKLEAHFAHILGISGYHSGHKYTMPSTLIQKKKVAMDPDLWMEQKISNFFESPPSLPPTLHQLINSGEQEIKLALSSFDYILTFVFALLGLITLFFIRPDWVNWLMSDFWIAPLFLINSLIIGSLIILLVIGPRIVSFGSHLVSPKVRLRKVWNRFRKTYPQLQHDTKQSKKTLLNQAQKNNKAQIATFKKQEKTFIAPLKVYLKEQDAAVHDLLKARKEDFETLIQGLKKKVKQNSIFRNTKGKNLVDFDRELELFYRRRTLELEKETLQELQQQEALKKYDQALDLIVKKDKAIRDALMIETSVVFDIDEFIKEKTTGNEVENKTLLNLLRANNIINILYIKNIYLRKEDDVLVIEKNSIFSTYFSSGIDRHPIHLSPITYSKGADLVAAFNSFVNIIKRTQKNDIRYRKDYFEMAYGAQKKAFKKEQSLLGAKKKALYKTLKEEIFNKKLADLNKKHQAAIDFLNVLQEEENLAIEQIDAQYEKLYQKIFVACENKVDLVAHNLENMNAAFKIAVEKLLQDPPMQKLKINFDKKIEQAKSDLLRLEKLKMD